MAHSLRSFPAPEAGAYDYFNNTPVDPNVDPMHNLTQEEREEVERIEKSTGVGATPSQSAATDPVDRALGDQSSADGGRPPCPTEALVIQPA